MIYLKEAFLLLVVFITGVFLLGCDIRSKEVIIDAIVSEPVQNRDTITFDVEINSNLSNLSDVYIIVKRNDDTVIHTTNFEDINLEGKTSIEVAGLEAGEIYFIKVYASYTYSTRNLVGINRVEHNVEDHPIGLGSVMMDRFDLYPIFLHFPESITLQQGEDFILSNYDILAIHEVEGDITSDITYSPLDIATLSTGEYILTLYVSSSNGNESSVDIQLIIT